MLYLSPKALFLSHLSQVLDHLCAITRLEDAGFPPELSETALQLFENNGDKVRAVHGRGKSNLAIQKKSL